MAILRSTFLLCGLFAVTPLAAQEAPTTPSRLHELGFMTGCWRGLSGNGSTIEEQYTTTSDNLILGVTRYLRAGVTRNFEFTVISTAGDGSTLLPHPGGKSGVTFLEASRSWRAVVWENPRHDYPQRITYERFTPDSMLARIELMDGSNATEYRMGKVTCLN